MKNAEQYVVYKRYLFAGENDEGVTYYVLTHHSNSVYTSEQIENGRGFIRWLDDQWQRIEIIKD